MFVQTPSSLGLPFEHVCLTTKDNNTISAYFIKQSSANISNVPTLLYFHGNAGNIGHRLNSAQALYQHCGFNVLLVEYRGYGKSHGSPSEKGIHPSLSLIHDSCNIEGMGKVMVHPVRKVDPSLSLIHDSCNRAEGLGFRVSFLDNFRAFYHCIL